MEPLPAVTEKREGMTAPRRDRRPVTMAAIAAVIATIALAPLMAVGWCNDSATPGASQCYSTYRSVIGIETTVWLWAAALALIAATTVLFEATRHLRERKATASDLHAQELPRAPHG